LPAGCFTIGRFALASDDSGSGEAAAEDDRGPLKSPRERAAHYRDYAAQIRDLAQGERNEPLRDRLIEIAREYEGLAKDLGLEPGSPRAN
jgi:hypothetical protein